ncbi:MAG: hypothetical protein A3D24_03235 [Candidatus Blackburnbacteria bacterium RIFCSPHIGHO2_02_FULL_39_13]|uniref:DUF4258 domain-containing protein n=1 Tax=Candidatus Blackburnbacteria bacterium RIFCSPLOWO2_01_FULL_40_20 TaxID=1797519 RepID=A0A1G1VG08_9BACT|nr:MAG: hypothetical protein A2694_04535 [Candidatus Blackburnbacteria bacterium RIFCSPHIGHO2_01_FULL_40_17]OGY08842.1 MAG: hypothetical protein A3D24_03235 [Candidatus Blackburnbacteria bacterium RIFCSPHIGHO2_02_FULL_39_13]OGY14216.1 MAG: hypothetical protein A3A77_01920 [Candidatus Blackburnbacteria bacterium RIFCSPLOWO2_01_FULL_40_20]HBL52426.1 hypothetical protein [Candidatus Blackburnbacteria bacterium]
MDQHYGGVIWTNHALQRLRERGIKQGDAWVTWRRPDKSRYATAQGAWIYYKTLGSEKIEVVAKQNEKKEWIILSVWSRLVWEGQHKSKTKPQASLMSESLLWTLAKVILRKLFKKN